MFAIKEFTYSMRGMLPDADSLVGFRIIGNVGENVIHSQVRIVVLQIARYPIVIRVSS